MAQQMTLSSRTLWPWLVAARDLGCDPLPVLEREELPEARLRDPGQRVRYGLARDLIVGLLELTGRSDLGLLAAGAVDSGHLDLFGLVVRSSATLGIAIEQAVRFLPLLDDGAALSFQRGASVSLLTYRSHDRPGVHAAYVEFLVAMLLLGVRRETGALGFAPLAIHFRHAPRAEHTTYEELFQAPIEFGASEDGAQVRNTDLELAFRRANPRTHRRAIEAGVELLPSRERSNGGIGGVRAQAL